MKLKNYNCESGSLNIEFTSTPISWKKIVSCLSTEKQNKKYAFGTNKDIVRAYLASEGTDYHYHFTARKYKNKIALEFEFHQDSHGVNATKLVDVHSIPKLESFLRELLPNTLQLKPLNLNWHFRFVFSKEKYTPIIDIPFKDPKLMPDKQHMLGNISISGLKIEFDGAPSGIVRIYFEAFPGFISLGTIVQLKIVLNDELLENVISSSYEVSKLFLKKKDQESI